MWHYTIMLADIGTLLGILLLTGLIALLLSREIKRTNVETDTATLSIEEERNALEKRIALRTQELIQSEKHRTQHLERIAQFGELSQGLFHDLMNPLTSVALYIEQMTDTQLSAAESQDIIQRAVETSRRMRSYMESVKRCLADESIQTNYSAQLTTELEIARDILAYKARMAGVTIVINNTTERTLSIHPLRVHQLFLNLISNSIDACMEKRQLRGDTYEGQITISITHNSEATSITVTDTGSGMSAENMANAFKRKFTTKKDGTGIGLMTIAEIVEKDLQGTLDITSIRGTSTSIAITIPVCKTTDHIPPDTTLLS